MFSFCLWAKEKVQGDFEQVIFSSMQTLGNLVSGEKKVNLNAFFLYTG